MARQVQIIKGTTAQNEAFTGAEGVLTYDSDKKDIRIHDGTTAGGFEIPSAAMADYVIYWDADDSGDHSHSKPGVPTPVDHGWYRIYKSGWVEQGGNFYGPLLVTLPITMANTAYSCFSGCGRKDGENWKGNPVTLVPETTTALGVYAYGDYPNMTGWWEVKGMSAQGSN